MDILGALPPELSIRALKYLTPVESIRVRLVSKSYHDLLTSEAVCSALSHHFIKREYNDAKKFDSWKLHYEHHVSRQLAYAFGKPWVTERLPYTWHSSFCPETSYFARDLGPGSGSVQVLDLNTYPAESVFPPTRMPDSSDIRKLVLLPSFVVVVTRENHGYSWNLKTHRVYRFEVPDLDYQSDRIHGNGTLIAIAFQDSVIVHDVQAEKVSSFKDIGNNTRIWDGVETVSERTTFVIANSEKRVVWLFRKLQFPILYDQIFAVDSLHLETGEVVLGEARSLPNHPPSCTEDPWQLWDTSWFNWHPGPAHRTKNAQKRRIVFDARTGAWAEEAYAVTFPACVTEFTFGGTHPRLIIRFDDLGHLVLGSSPSLFWTLGEKLGAFPLSPGGPAPLSCLGLCDKFLVGITGMGAGTERASPYLIRFKGVHDCVG